MCSFKNQLLLRGAAVRCYRQIGEGYQGVITICYYKFCYVRSFVPCSTIAPLSDDRWLTRKRKTRAFQLIAQTQSQEFPKLIITVLFP